MAEGPYLVLSGFVHVNFFFDVTVGLRYKSKGLYRNPKIVASSHSSRLSHRKVISKKGTETTYIGSLIEFECVVTNVEV